MQFLVYGIITSSLTFEYLAVYGLSFLPFVQELLGLVAAAVVVAAGTQQRFRYVLPGYWLVFGAFAVILVCGLLTNGVDSGPTFAGVRLYLRALPFFFLPAVVMISERQIKAQLVLILIFAVIQLPIALDQRLTTFAQGWLSGDRTVGTLLLSGDLSIFLICVASFVLAFYVRRRLSLGWTLILLPLVLAPTLLNETKATLFLVPLALFAILVLGATANRLRKSLAVLVGVSVFTAAFIPTYDYFIRPRWGYGIVDFFMMEDRVEEYLSRDVEVGEYEEAGKLDGLTVPIRVLSRDPSLLAFGLGIGNVSESALGLQFTGEHYQRYGHFVQSFASLLLWETGLLGLALALGVLAMLFVDAYRVSRGDGFMAALGLGSMGMIAVTAVSLPYATAVYSGALTYLFWYVAGLICAERARNLARGAVSVPAPASSPLASAA